MIHWLKYMKGFHSTTLLTEGYRSLDKVEYQQVEVARVIMVRPAGRKNKAARRCHPEGSHGGRIMLHGVRYCICTLPGGGMHWVVRP